MSEPPFLLVFAGPNGSGKSTLTNYLIKAGLDFGNYINPDDIAAALSTPEPQRSKEAQRIADKHRENCLSSRSDFSFETVMSHPSKLDFMIRAVNAGYEVTLYFVCTSDPEINVRRIENRVRLGGHPVPHDRIVARYWRSLNLLCHAAMIANRTVLFDNSSLVGYRATSLLPNPQSGLTPVCEMTGNGKDYRISVARDAPGWAVDFFVKPIERLAQSPNSAITLDMEHKAGPLT